MLFNVDLEEALGHTQKLKHMIYRENPLAFANEMLTLTNYKTEMTQAIQKLEILRGIKNI